MAVHAWIWAHLAMLTAWIVVGLAGWGAWRAGRARAPFAALLGGIAVLGLLLRLAVPAGWGDVNPRSVEVFAWTPQTGWGYGVAWPHVWRAWLPGPFRTPDGLLHAHAVVGALTPVAVAVWLRSAGTSRVVAALAAFALAVDPVHVRWSHTDTPGILGGLAWVLAAGALARVQQAPDRPRRDDAVLLGAAGALAVTARPEAILLAPLAWLLVWAHPGRVPWRDPWVGGSLAVAAGYALGHVAGVLVWNPGLTTGRVGLTWPPAPLFHGPSHYAILDPAWTSPVVALLVIVGAAIAPGPWPRRAGWGLFALGAASLVLEVDWSPVGAILPSLVRHQLLAWPAFAALAGFAIGRVVEDARLPGAPGPRLVAVAVGLAMVQVPGLMDAWPPYTAHADRAFFRAAVEDLPDDCMVHVGVFGEDLEFKPSAVGLPVRLTYVTGPAPVPASRCAYFYRTAECSAVGSNGRPLTEACASAEAAWPLVPVASRRVAARPFLGARYPGDEVELALFRVVRDRDGR